MYETLLHMNARTKHGHTHTHSHTHSLTYTSFLHMTRRRKKIYNIADEEEEKKRKLVDCWAVGLEWCYYSDTIRYPSCFDHGATYNSEKEKREKKSGPKKSGVFLCSFCFVLTHFFHNFHFELDFDLSWKKNLSCDLNERMKSGCFVGHNHP